MIGWFTLFKLGIGMILFTYCFSFMFNQVKTASKWFTLILIILGLSFFPIQLFSSNKYLKYLTFIKYLLPFYDTTAIVTHLTFDAQLGQFINTGASEQ